MTRRLPPDRRPSWRNPAMPVLREYKFGNGTTKTEVDPDYERRYREHLMEISSNPSWKDDPTYNMRRKRK
jgi:hypothetical protein